MIPKVDIIELPSIGDTTILTVPSGKVIEIHEINVHNLSDDPISYIAKITRSSTTCELRGVISIPSGLKSPRTFANKKSIAMDGDVIKINQNSDPLGPNDPTVSLHYTEWDIGEIPGIRLKSVINKTLSDIFTTIISTSVSIPRIVIRDFLVHNSTDFSASPAKARLHTSSIDNLIEDISIPISPNDVDGGSTQRWVLEQNGAVVMDWQQKTIGFGNGFNYILSYIEHTDV